MPSGNTTVTYVGDEETITVGGQDFVRGEPILLHDNGVIGMVSERDDFEAGEPKAEKKAPKAKA